MLNTGARTIARVVSTPDGPVYRASNYVRSERVESGGYRRRISTISVPLHPEGIAEATVSGSTVGALPAWCRHCYRRYFVLIEILREAAKSSGYVLALGPHGVLLLHPRRVNAPG